MAGIGITIESDDLNDLLRTADRLEGGLKSKDLFLLVGRKMQQTTKEHLEGISRDEAHHQSARSLGASPSGFYERASQAVQSPQLETEGISVSIAHEGLAQRYYGGEIEAKPRSFLTIPARAEAYGKRAKDFSFLKLIIFKDTELAALVDKDEEAHEGSVYYWLVRSVNQPGDKTVLPTDEAIIDPALESVSNYIDRLWERQAA